ncbi:MAG: winged helix-turn-helix domain-containing protein, partial [Alphaproteobacteria bacterium]
AVEQVCRALDTKIAYRNLQPFGEPHLSKYGLYPSTGLSGLTSLGDFHRAVLWLLNYSDGMNDLLSISARAGLSPALLHDAARACVEKGLVEPAPAPRLS